MKKSNIAVTVLLILISAFLMFLWFYLGFYQVDNPLDLTLSFVWWALVLVAIVAIVRVEKTRRLRIRTLYVTPDAVFNSEAGLSTYVGPDQLLAIMSRSLNNLEYKFLKADVPDLTEFTPQYLVRTKKFDSKTWEGTVVFAETKTEEPFTNKEELLQIVEKL